MTYKTLNAINFRLSNGKTDFIIGDRSYHLKANGILYHYYNGSDMPIIDGIVENRTLNPSLAGKRRS